MKYWIIWATNDRILIVFKRVSPLLLIFIINLGLTRFLRQKIYISYVWYAIDCIITSFGEFTSIENKSSVIYTLYFYSFNYSRCLCCPEIQNHHTEEVNIFFSSRTVRPISAFMSACLTNSWKIRLNMYAYSFYVKIMLIYCIILRVRWISVLIVVKF